MQTQTYNSLTQNASAYMQKMRELAAANATLADDENYDAAANAIIAAAFNTQDEELIAELRCDFDAEHANAQ